MELSTSKHGGRRGFMARHVGVRWGQIRNSEASGRGEDDILQDDALIEAEASCSVFPDCLPFTPEEIKLY